MAQAGERQRRRRAPRDQQAVRPAEVVEEGAAGMGETAGTVVDEEVDDAPLAAGAGHAGSRASAARWTPHRVRSGSTTVTASL